MILRRHFRDRAARHPEFDRDDAGIAHDLEAALLDLIEELRQVVDFETEVVDARAFAGGDSLLGTALLVVFEERDIDIPVGQVPRVVVAVTPCRTSRKPRNFS